MKVAKPALEVSDKWDWEVRPSLTYPDAARFELFGFPLADTYDRTCCLCGGVAGSAHLQLSLPPEAGERVDICGACMATIAALYQIDRPCEDRFDEVIEQATT